MLSSPRGGEATIRGTELPSSFPKTCFFVPGYPTRPWAGKSFELSLQPVIADGLLFFDAARISAPRQKKEISVIGRKSGEKHLPVRFVLEGEKLPLCLVRYSNSKQDLKEHLTGYRQIESGSKGPLSNGQNRPNLAF